MEFEKKKAKKKKEKEAAQMAKLLGIAKDEAKVVSCLSLFGETKAW